MDNASLTAIATQINVGGNLAALWGPFLRLVPVTGGAISTLVAPFGVETLCASDAEAGRIDEFQVDLGEGPGWDALEKRSPVCLPDLRRDGGAAWPAFHDAISASNIRGMFAFPLIVGTLPIGVLDLYSDSSGPLTGEQTRDVVAVSMLVARRILHEALKQDPDAADPYENVSAYSRREVHQATGMVLAQLGIPADDALLVIRGHAFATNQSVRDVAALVVARTIDFSVI